MDRLLKKYANKLVQAGLAEPGAPLLAGLDAELVWNRHDPAGTVLEKVFTGLNINSLLFCRPAEPYHAIINYLASQADGPICPNDSETRTFLHDLPVTHEFASAEIINALKQRKSVIIPGQGIVTSGTVSPEQAFVSYSSVCFACFVKFFSDYLSACRIGTVDEQQQQIFDRSLPLLDVIPEQPPSLMPGPFATEAMVYMALSEAGQKTVEYRLVDSYFGNISYRFNDTLYISQTASSLDELDGYVDPVPLDGSSCAGITASSELTAHREIIRMTANRAILHGHPKFSVILSMDCDKTNCDKIGQCHIRCPEQRFVADIPIVPGEVGTGPHGLCHTMPPAIYNRRGVIVYGHGVFTVGKIDFTDAFKSLVEIEKMCSEEYMQRVHKPGYSPGTG